EPLRPARIEAELDAPADQKVGIQARIDGERAALVIEEVFNLHPERAGIVGAHAREDTGDAGPPIQKHELITSGLPVVEALECMGGKPAKHPFIAEANHAVE